MILKFFVLDKKVSIVLSSKGWKIPINNISFFFELNFLKLI